MSARPDVVLWIETESSSGTIRKAFPVIKREGVVTKHMASSGAGSTASAGPDAGEGAPRRMRADAQRNIDSLLEAAKVVFGTSGL